jgi:type II secretory pathway component PulK
VLEFTTEIAALGGLRPRDPAAGSIAERWLTVRGSERVNVNTAPHEVLGALDERIDEIWIKSVGEARQTRPFDSVGAVFQRVPTASALAGELAVLLTTRSTAFRLRVEARAEAVSEGLEAWFERSGRLKLAAAHWRRAR